MVNEQTHLTISNCLALQEVLERSIRLFQGMWGNWRGKPIHLESVSDAKLHAARPFHMSQPYKELFKKEVKRLVGIGLLAKVEALEWASPSFAIPKKD